MQGPLNPFQRGHCDSKFLNWIISKNEDYYLFFVWGLPEVAEEVDWIWI
jgi:hypothetical protein